MTETKTTPPSLPFTVHADLTEYRKRIGLFRYTLAAIILVVTFLRFGPLTGGIVTVVVVVTAAIVLFALAKRSITLTNEGIERRTAFGGVKTLSYDQMTDIKMFAGYIEPGFGHAPRILIGKKEGGPALSLVTLYWNIQEVDQMLLVLEEKGIKGELYDQLATSAMISKQFPTYVSWAERHPYLLAFGVVGALVVVVTVFVFLTYK